MLGLRIMLHSHMLYINCLCFDSLVHNIASSKTTVDLNKEKGMLLFNSVLVALEHTSSSGGIRRKGDKEMVCFLPLSTWNCQVEMYYCTCL